jgi:hypothetical protein
MNAKYPGTSGLRTATETPRPRPAARPAKQAETARW